MNTAFEAVVGEGHEMTFPPRSQAEMTNRDKAELEHRKHGACVTTDQGHCGSQFPGDCSLGRRGASEHQAGYKRERNTAVRDKATTSLVAGPPI